MKIGLIPVNIGVDSAADMIGLAQHAESLGYESVWTFEHVIVPLEYASKYPYNTSGKMGAAPETNFIDPLIALTAIATHTTTLRLGTGVNILSQTNPLTVAKQSASLDLISNGRFMLGVGIGWLREEFDAMGTPFERRGARFDDYLNGMRKIWSGDVVEHESDFLSWHGFKSYPVPVQDPFPVIIGGSKGKVFERIATLGQGWYAPSASAEELAPMLEQLKAACNDAGRDYEDVELTTMWPGHGGMDQVAKFAELGVSRLVVPVQALGANPAEGMAKLAEEVIGN
jgi:probable F420-dependent oxidoreductase